MVASGGTCGTPASSCSRPPTSWPPSRRTPPAAGPGSQAAVEGAEADLGFLRLDPDAWAGVADISIDYAMMERPTTLGVPLTAPGPTWAAGRRSGAKAPATRAAWSPAARPRRWTAPTRFCGPRTPGLELVGHRAAGHRRRGHARRGAGRPPATAPGRQAGGRRAEGRARPQATGLPATTAPGAGSRRWPGRPVPGQAHRGQPGAALSLQSHRAPVRTLDRGVGHGAGDGGRRRCAW